ncbi:MAG: VOC family protein [Frankiaceae bacterium]|nr:VOC family protein [Frankiaceae bacterium]MBV9870510.1 VOC family protein [Frankiaceae bacterium]
MALQSFSHIGICVTDLEVSTRFYTQVLGFRELFSADFGDELVATMEADGSFTSRMLARDDLRIELLHWHDQAPSGDGERCPMTARGITHLCFRVEAVDDLLDLAETYGGTAHPATRTDLDGGVAVVYLTDPDGVRIECMAGVPDLAG